MTRKDRVRDCAGSVFFHAKASDVRVISQMFCVDKGARCTI